MPRTEFEINAELLIVNGALQSLYSGTRLKELRIDTHILKRHHVFTEVTLQSLLTQKNILEQELLALTTTLPTFRHYTSLPIVVNKQGVY